jgi:hypothetical protein
VGERVSVLVEGCTDDGVAEGRAEHQGPEVDGSTRIVAGAWPVGAMIPAVVVGSDGVDLVARAVVEAMEVR